VNKATRDALQYVLGKIQEDERKLERDVAELSDSLGRAQAQLDGLRERLADIRADLEQL
jgi:predicted  nucleic acid-binding Zn-ribbon protein